MKARKVPRHSNLHKKEKCLEVQDELEVPKRQLYETGSLPSTLRVVKSVPSVPFQPLELLVKKSMV